MSVADSFVICFFSCLISSLLPFPSVFSSFFWLAVGSSLPSTTFGMDSTDFRPEGWMMKRNGFKACKTSCVANTAASRHTKSFLDRANGCRVASQAAWYRMENGPKSKNGKKLAKK